MIQEFQLCLLFVVLDGTSRSAAGKAARGHADGRGRALALAEGRATRGQLSLQALCDRAESYSAGETHFYHCHFGTSMHMQAEMYGAFIVERPDELVHAQYHAYPLVDRAVECDAREDETARRAGRPWRA